MAKANQDVSMSERSFRRVKCAVTDAAGTAYDLTTATAIVWSVADSVDSLSRVTKTLAAGEITLIDMSATKDGAQVDLTAALGLMPGTYYHDLRVTGPSPTDDIGASGTLTITQAVS